MANTVIIQAGGNGFLSVLKYGAVNAEVFDINTCILEPSQDVPASYGVFTLRINSVETIFSNQPYSSIINGATGLPFLSIAALNSFIRANFYRNANGGMGIDSKIIYLGDSITQHGFNLLSGGYYYVNNGFSVFANILSGSKLYQPINGNQGISGDRTDQMIARMGKILNLRPNVIVIEAGTNDFSQSVPLATVIANYTTIINAFKSINATILALTVFPRYSPTAPLSTADEANRQLFNAWLLSNPDIRYVVNAESILTSGSLYEDGLHPTTQGAFLIGQDLAVGLSSLTGSASAAFQINPEAVGGYNLSGTGGSLAGATGVVATGWTIKGNGGGNDAGGATAVGSISSNNALNQQVITLSGTYSGTSKSVLFTQDFTTSYYAVNDVIECILDIEILSPFVNISSLRPHLQVWTTGFGASLAFAEGFYPISGEVMPLPTGRYIIKSPPIQIVGGTPAIVTTSCVIGLNDTGSSLPVSGQFRINILGTRKINPISLY